MIESYINVVEHIYQLLGYGILEQPDPEFATSHGTLFAQK